LDSGTTFTYLNGGVWDNLKTKFDAHCKDPKNTPKQGKVCGGQSNYLNEYCVTYTEDAYGTLENFWSTLPKFYFNLANKTEIIWFPKDYMYLETKLSPKVLKFCSSINKENMSGNQYSTFGSLFMRHYDIYFDRSKRQVSFVRSECEDRSDRAYPVRGIKKLVEKARILLASVMGSWAGFLSVVFVFATLLAYSGYRLSIMRGWLAKTQGDELLEKAKEVVGNQSSEKKLNEGVELSG